MGLLGPRGKRRRRRLFRKRRAAPGAALPDRTPRGPALTEVDDLPMAEPTSASPSPTSAPAAPGDVEDDATTGRASVGVAQPLRATGSSRLQKRRQRTRRRRISGVVTVVALGVTAAVATGFAVNRAVTRDDPPAPKVRTQRTMLMQVRGSDGLARSSVLVAHDPARDRAAMIFLPPGVLALAPGLGTVPFEEALQLRGPAASRGAVAELLGVTVDHDWTLNEAALVGLVERLGTIRVDVDVDVVVPDGTRKVLLVSPGSDQDLDGAQALAFATYVAPGEDQLGALPRLQEVLEGILDKVEDADALTPLLEAISRGAPGSLAPAGIAEFLAGVAADRRADRISYATLPVVPIESGARRLRYRLDEVAALELVNRDLAESVPEGRFSGDKRVIIQNGVGSPGITTTAQQKLSTAGFDIVRVGNANRFNYATSVILVRDATAASTQLGNEVARLLGLKPTAVRVNPQRNTVTDVIVILGRDYRR